MDIVGGINPIEEVELLLLNLIDTQMIKLDKVYSQCETSIDTENKDAADQKAVGAGKSIID